ncbi:hypothetical protein VFPBJ_11766 [Purpureocillium lilacinum]|uniref:Uncharacterized protein n=1 Tax=Purpureocillium lilacinum TaxID=33203 RepID=A0A179EVW0_PURLI|nr:hypothetical protein VFPBJ_11766 [Purpureocillium lilacinum]
MSGTETTPRALGDPHPENVKFVMGSDTEMVSIPVHWKMLCEHPDIVRRELGLSSESLQVGDDMTRSFDTLDCEASLVLAPVLRRLDSAVSAIPNDVVRQPGRMTRASAASAVLERDSLERRVDTYRRWSRLFRQLGGDGWSETDFGRCWDTALADLSESMWLSGVTTPHSCLSSLGMQCLCCTAFTTGQVQALRCVYPHLTLLMITVMVRPEDAVERAALRLERLWKRVRHYLKTGEDDPSLAEPPTNVV